ncbi:MAG: alpha/beta fold hydrolase [Treponema sp.]|nr:alpha/beta fold hydrolase [Treponema sp.]
MAEQRPEIANSIQTGAYKTNYHDMGQGEIVTLLHGSGPGVTAWANWGRLFPLIKDDFRVIAPDMSGFGYTERAPGMVNNMPNWVKQTVDLLDALKIEKTNLVGNSFGGALAISLAVRHPDRINKMVLMGSMGVSFPITYGLNRGWGYEPSLEAMGELLELFTYDHSFANEELIKSRYEASIRPGFQESFSALFPEPRQNGVESMAADQNYIRNIKQETLIIHGRDDRVIPMDNALRLHQLIDNSQLHVFGHCGHWTQIEHAQEFADLIRNFFKFKKQ